MSDELVQSANVHGGLNNVGKLKVILDNIKIYQNLLEARKWFEN